MFRFDADNLPADADAVFGLVFTQEEFGQVRIDAHGLEGHFLGRQHVGKTFTSKEMFGDAAERPFEDLARAVQVFLFEKDIADTEELFGGLAATPGLLEYLPIAIQQFGRLWGVFERPSEQFGGRIVALYARYGIHDTLDGHTTLGQQSYMPSTARDIAANVVLHSMLAKPEPTEPTTISAPPAE